MLSLQKIDKTCRVLTQLELFNFRFRFVYLQGHNILQNHKKSLKVIPIKNCLALRPKLM